MPEIPSNILAEHQGALNTPSEAEGEGYDPTPEEQKSLKLVETLLARNKKFRERVYDRHWPEYYRMFRGKQWLDKRPSYRHSEVLNYIQSEVLNVLVLLTDNRPNITVLPEDPTDYEFSEIINEILTSKWDNNNWAQVLAEGIVDAAIYGTAIFEVPWKKELAQGLGDFAFETVDPCYFYVDCNARNKVNDEYCSNVITAVPTDVGKIKAMFPDVAQFIKPDVQEMSTMDRDTLEEIKFVSPTDNRVLSHTNGPTGQLRGTNPNQAVLITAYLKPEETVEAEVGEEADPDTGLKTKLFQSMKKYPNGRCIVICNQVVCKDDENPYTDGKFPYAKFADTQMPREFWGIGEVEFLKSPQVIINKLISYVLDVLMITGNPVWIVDTSSGIDTDNLTNQPGLVVEKTPGSEVRRESGAQLQPFVMQTLEFMINNVMGKLGSTSEVSKGAAPYDNSSGYAIAQLLEASQTKIRGKGRNLEAALKEVGDLMFDRIMEGYSLPRIVRLTSNEESAKFFKFYVGSSTDETGAVTKFAEIAEYKKDPMNGQYIEEAPRRIEIKSRLDVRMEVGTSLPYAKTEKRVIAEKLFDKGIIDEEEFLTQLDYPRKEKILEKLNQKKALAAEQAAAGMPVQGAANGVGAATPPGPTAGPAVG